LRLEAADTVYYLAHHITDKNQKRKVLGEGIEWAKQAIALNPQGAGGHLYYGMLTGMRAEVSGIIEGLKSKDVIKREMEKVIELDPAYSDGDAYLALGQWYALVPFFMGGSSKKAQENLNKAVEINPNRTMPHLALAEFYSGNLQYDMAKQEIDRVLAIPMNGKNNFEAKRDQEKARELLKKIVSRLSVPSRGYQQGSVSSSYNPSTP
jgi:tetratricopeptide (TPR) repeat protein